MTAARKSSRKPKKPAAETALNPAIRARAMPADTNPAGDIFGGWIVSHMDLAGEIAARHRAHGRVVTVAIHTMEFHLPVHVGDVVSFYTSIEKVGRTSISVRIRAEAMSEETGRTATVTEGLFVYVALGKDGRPTPVDG